MLQVPFFFRTGAFFFRTGIRNGCQMVPDKMHFRELLNKYYVTYAIKETHVVIKNIKVTENAFYLAPSGTHRLKRKRRLLLNRLLINTLHISLIYPSFFRTPHLSVLPVQKVGSTAEKRHFYGV